MSRLLARRYQQSAGIVQLACLGLGCSVAVEFMQIFIYSRVCAVDDILWGSLGFLLGGWFMPNGLRGERSTFSTAKTIALAIAVLMYIAGLFTFFWYPFHFDFQQEQVQQRASQFFAVPLAKLYAGSEFHAMDEIIRKTLLFVLLALMLGLASRFPQAPPPARIRRLMLIFLFCAGLGAVIEAGQIVMEEHFPDITDVGLYLLGGLIGTWLLAFLFPVSETMELEKSRPRSA